MYEIILFLISLTVKHIINYKVGGICNEINTKES